MVLVLPKQSCSMLTRDGVRLDADVYYPQGEGPFPVLLMRQPYGKAIASTVVYAPPTWYVAHGYIVVIQDVRGRGTSEGEFTLFANEIEDGADSVIWAASLPKSSGRVGMYGFSYQGMTQLYAAIGLARNYPHLSPSTTPLKTLSPAMVGYDLYADWAYEGGAFCLQSNWGWAVQLAAETARRQGDGTCYQQLYAAARGPGDYDPVSGRSPLLSRLAPDCFYHDWLDHPTPDAYWQTLSPCTQFQTIDLPMLHIGGWFDGYMRGTLRLYREMASRSRYPQHLWVGPWTHLPWGRYVGELDCGIQASSEMDRQQIRWFDHWLKDESSDSNPNGSVQLFVMGRNQWRSHFRWPTVAPTEYWLDATGLVSIQAHAGVLIPAPIQTVSASSKTVSASRENVAFDTLIHDPWRPVPAGGGHGGMPSGPRNRATLGDRTDILTYTTSPFSQPITLTGVTTVELHCKTDAASFDLCAVLSEVYPDGVVYAMAQGYQRVEPTAVTDGVIQVAIALQPTCFEVQTDHALQLSISAACYPAYALNSGTGAAAGQDHLIKAQIITVAVYRDSLHRSRLLLPIAPAAQTLAPE